MSVFLGMGRQRLSRAIERNGGRLVCFLLAVVLTLGLAGRLASVAAPETPSGDAKGYLLIAASLYEHQRFSPPDHREHRELLNPGIYSPGLPLLLAGIYEIAGGIRPTLGMVVIAILGTVTIWFTFRIGVRVAGQAVGLIAAAIIAGYPYLLETHRRVLTEPLAAFSLSAAVLAVLWARERRRIWPWALPGLLLGAHAMVRPEYLAIAGAFVAIVFLTGTRERGMCHGAATAGMLAATIILALAPWVARNLGAQGRLDPISSGGGKALFIGTYLPGGGTNLSVKHRIFKRPDVQAYVFEHYGGNGAIVFNTIYLDEMLEFLVSKSHPELTFDQALRAMAVENLRHALSEQPVALLRMFVNKAWIMWSDGWTARQPAWTAFHRATVAAALLGLVAIAWRKRWEGLVVAVPILGTTAIGMLMLASERRVLAMFPLVAVLAGIGCVEILAAIRRLLSPPGGRGAVVAWPLDPER